MYEDLLEDIGLTKSEIAVYFALLELGPSTTGPIIKKAGIASGKAYLVLDKLAIKGLVTHAIKSGVKYFQAKDPERLLDYLREKGEQLRQKEEGLVKIIPTLRAKYEAQKYKSITEIFEGAKSYKTLLDLILKETKKGSTVYIMGVPKEALEKFDTFLRNWNKCRIALGVSMRIIYNYDCKPYGKIREKMRLTEVRYMKPELETPAWIDVFGDYVATIIVHGTPMCFLIRNKEAADSYRKYFDLLWRQSRR